MSVPPLQLSFVKAVNRHGDLDPSPAEVAIVGRSNAGKSSLVNAVAHRKQLAMVSNTPGRTQQLVQFTLPGGQTIVDLPGYGYAKVPAHLKAGWQRMIEGYLLEREPLVRVLVLVDGVIGPAKLDVQLLAWLDANEVAHDVVATKLDKVKPSTLGARKAALAAGCARPVPEIVWTSAAKGTGIDTLRRRILDLLAVRR